MLKSIYYYTEVFVGKALMSVTIIIEMDARQPKPLFLHPVKKRQKSFWKSLQEFQINKIYWVARGIGPSAGKLMKPKVVGAIWLPVDEV